MDTKQQIKQNEKRLEKLINPPKCSLCENDKLLAGFVIHDKYKFCEDFRPFLLYNVKENNLYVTTYDKKPIISININFCPNCRQTTNTTKGGDTQ